MVHAVIKAIDGNQTKCVLVELQGSLESDKELLAGLSIGNMEFDKQVSASLSQ